MAFSIGPDIKQCFREVGAEYHVAHGVTVISGEYCVVQPESPVSRTLSKAIVGFIRNIDLPYDASVLPGDIIDILVTDEKYIAVDVSPDAFQNFLISNKMVGLRCNVFSGELWRQSGQWYGTQAFGSDYQMAVHFEKIQDNISAVVVNDWGSKLHRDPSLDVPVRSIELYVAPTVPARIGDRYLLHSGEYYEVGSVMGNEHYAFLSLSLLPDSR